VKIAILGPGAIGSTFALHLARAGHDVTVIARGQRLAFLQGENAIVADDDARTPVIVRAELDLLEPWDLVLVTVLASQVEPLLPALERSAAKHVMFMFNTFEPLARLRGVVGPSRFAFGFPAIVAQLEHGKLRSQVVPRIFSFFQITTVSEPRWAEVFSRAGIPTRTHPDMESWLRTHAALMVPLLVVGSITCARGAGLTWTEAGAVARAMDEGFELVTSLGARLTPTSMVLTHKTPTALLRLGVWLMSRLPAIAELGRQGPGEARSLIDAMSAAGPSKCETLRSLRP
jgi:2-dehydropantoate 2-reductase